MDVKPQSLIANSFFMILCFVAVILVESSSNTGKLRINLRNRLDFPAAAQPASLSSASASSRAPSSDGPNIIYEDGFVIETVLDENRLGISIYSTLAVPFEDFLYAVDSTASQLLKIRLPIDQDARHHCTDDASLWHAKILVVIAQMILAFAMQDPLTLHAWVVQSRRLGSSGSVVARRVAGDGKGQTGHSDGWGEDSLLDHPKGLAIDIDGNVYVADVRNRVIRKISPGGFVTTIAGQHNQTGHIDGEGKDALLSADFTLTYLPRSCALLISDRGNGRLRLIHLKKPPLKCDYEAFWSDRKWKNVTFFLGVLVTILSAILGVVLYQKAELQHNVGGYLAQEHEGGSPLNQHHNGGSNYLPFHSTRPRLSDSATSIRRGNSLPNDISTHDFLHRDDLIDFTDHSPLRLWEHNQSRNLLGNSHSDVSGDAENDDFLSISRSPSQAADGTSTRDRPQIKPSEQDLLSNSESMSTRPDDNSTAGNLPNNSALLTSGGGISIDDEINRHFLEFGRSCGDQRVLA